MSKGPSFRPGFGVGAAVALIVGVGVILAADRWSTKPQLVITAMASDTAVVGTEFIFSMEMFNPHAESVELNNIEVPSQTRELLEVLAVSPEALRIGFDGMGVWYIEKDVAAGARQSVAFTMRPRRAGSGLIELNVCNASGDCSPVTHTIEIISR